MISSIGKNAKIGFVGLGRMGSPMAARLLGVDFDVATFSRSGTPSSLIERGARNVLSLGTVAEEAAAVITMLPDTGAVEQVVFGENGLVDGLRPGAFLIDMSTISPEATKSFHQRLKSRGVRFVDAPVSGGVAGAEAGTLTIFTGGDQEAAAAVEPLLKRLGQSVTYFGAAGSGQTAKLVNQIIVAINIQGLAEGFALAARQGLCLASLRRALMGGFASSKVLDAHGQRVVEQDYEPGARLTLHLKDMNMALAAAEAAGLDIRHARTCRDTMAKLVERGFGDWDHSFLAEPQKSNISSRQAGQT